MRPTPFPECLKLSSKSKSSHRPHFKRPLETPPPGSLPRLPCLTLALQVLGFLPQVHTGRGLQGPILARPGFKMAHKGIVSETCLPR